MKKFILLFVCLSGLLYSTLAQENEYFQWKTYLQNYMISDIADAGDYLWLSTGKEILKFEKSTGYVFQYGFDNINLSQDYSISTVKCDRKGLPWVGVSFTGTLKLNEEENWILLPPVNTDALAKSTKDILFADDGAVWTISPTMLVKYYGDEITIYNVPDSSSIDGTIISIANDKEGNLWFGTANYFHDHYDGLVKFDGENWRVYNSSSTGSIPLAFNPIVIDENGTKCMGAYLGIDYYASKLVSFNADWKVYDLPVYSHIRPIAIKNNLIWIGTNNGLMQFNKSDWIVYNVSNSGLPSNNIYSIVIDDDGTKWIGMDNGLVSFAENNSETYAQSESNELVTVVDLQSKMISEINIFPNPANDYIIIKKPQELKNFKVDILNIQGKTVKTLSEDEINNQLDISNLVNGIYMVQIQTGESYFLKKFVKQ